MTLENSSLADVVGRLHAAIVLLRVAERQWPEALQAEVANTPEFKKLEELLHCATHEMGSTLGLLTQDIQALVAFSKVRGRHSLFTEGQFNRIVQQGWSLRLVQDLHEEHPAMGLAELSARVKRISEELSFLPPAKHAEGGA